MKIELSGPLRQNEITMYWGEIEQTIMETISPSVGVVDTQVTVAATQTAIRQDTTWVLAIWKDDRVNGFMLTKPYQERGGKPSLLLHALWSSGDIQDDEWVEVGRQLEQIAAGTGYSSLIAVTDNPRMRHLADVLGWTQKWTCTKKLQPNPPCAEVDPVPPEMATPATNEPCETE